MLWVLCTPLLPPLCQYQYGTAPVTPTCVTTSPLMSVHPTTCVFSLPNRFLNCTTQIDSSSKMELVQEWAKSIPFPFAIAVSLVSATFRFGGFCSTDSRNASYPDCLCCTFVQGWESWVTGNSPQCFLLMLLGQPLAAAGSRLFWVLDCLQHYQRLCNQWPDVCAWKDPSFWYWYATVIAAVVHHQFKALYFALSTAPLVFTRGLNLVLTWAYQNDIPWYRLDKWLIVADFFTCIRGPSPPSAVLSRLGDCHQVGEVRPRGNSEG